MKILLRHKGGYDALINTAKILKEHGICLDVSDLFCLRDPKLYVLVPDDYSLYAGAGDLRVAQVIQYAVDLVLSIPVILNAQCTVDRVNDCWVLNLEPKKGDDTGSTPKPNVQSAIRARDTEIEDAIEEGIGSDVRAAIRNLDQFTKNWCLDREATAEADEPKFRCKECIFCLKGLRNYEIFGKELQQILPEKDDTRQNVCMIKYFANQQDKEFTESLDFGCMSR